MNHWPHSLHFSLESRPKVDTLKSFTILPEPWHKGHEPPLDDVPLEPLYVELDVLVPTVLPV